MAHTGPLTDTHIEDVVKVSAQTPTNSTKTTGQGLRGLLKEMRDYYDNKLGSVESNYYTASNIDKFFSGLTAKSGYNKSNWDAAFGWGNHAGLYAPLAGSANYIQNQISTPQNASFNLSGSGVLGTLMIGTSTAVSGFKALVAGGNLQIQNATNPTLRLLGTNHWELQNVTSNNQLSLNYNSGTLFYYLYDGRFGTGTVQTGWLGLRASAANNPHITLTPGAAYTSTINGALWYETTNRLRLMKGPIASDVLFSYDNFLLKGSNNRMLEVNQYGDISAVNEIAELFVWDSDLETAIKGATYDSANNYTTTINVGGKSVLAGQWYDGGSSLYFATGDNRVTRISKAINSNEFLKLTGGTVTGQTIFNSPYTTFTNLLDDVNSTNIDDFHGEYVLVANSSGVIGRKPISGLSGNFTEVDTLDSVLARGATTARGMTITGTSDSVSYHTHILEVLRNKVELTLNEYNYMVMSSGISAGSFYSTYRNGSWIRTTSLSATSLDFNIENTATTKKCAFRVQLGQELNGDPIVDYYAYPVGPDTTGGGTIMGTYRFHGKVRVTDSLIAENEMILASASAYSSGGYDVLVRNQTTGTIEKIASNALQTSQPVATLDSVLMAGSSSQHDIFLKSASGSDFTQLHLNYMVQVARYASGVEESKSTISSNYLESVETSSGVTKKVNITPSSFDIYHTDTVNSRVGYFRISTLFNGTDFETGFLIGQNGVASKLYIDAKLSLSGPVLVYGSVTATSFNQSSERSLKTNILKFERNASEILGSVNVVEFKYKSALDTFKVGIIADDTDPIISGEKKDSFQLSDTTALLIKASQEKDEKIKFLEDKLLNLLQEFEQIKTKYKD